MSNKKKVDHSEPKSTDTSQEVSTTTTAKASINPRRLIMKIVVPIAVTLFLLCLVEVFLQIVMPLPFSDKLYWIADGHVKARLEPNQPVTNTHGNPVHINQYGYRGPEWSWHPSPGTLRLLVLGGSAAFCFQVTDDAHTWAAQLEQMLAKRLKNPVEVLNLGLPGYDTSNSKVHYLFAGRAFHPHVVLVYHTWNDFKFLVPIDSFRGDGMPRDALSGRPSASRNVSPFRRVFRRLQIVRRADKALTPIFRKQRENQYTSLEMAGARAHRPLKKRTWQWFQRNFEDVTNFVHSDGVLPVLVSQATLAKKKVLNIQSHRQMISNNFVGMTLPRLAENYKHATQIIKDVAFSKGAIYVDGYNAVPPDLTHLHDHVHLIDKGATVLAKAITNELLADERFTSLALRVRGQTVGESR